MKPTSLYPIDTPFVIQRIAIPKKGSYKLTVPEDYELAVCDNNKETLFFGSGRIVEIKGKRRSTGVLYWIPLKPQTITYSKDGHKIQVVVRFFNPTQLINNGSSSLDLRTMLKPLTPRIDRLIADHTTAYGLRKSIETMEQEIIEPMGLRLVGEINIEQKERRL
jgi:hypothetical protein